MTAADAEAQQRPLDDRAARCLAEVAPSWQHAPRPATASKAVATEAPAPRDAASQAPGRCDASAQASGLGRSDSAARSRARLDAASVAAFLNAAAPRMLAELAANEHSVAAAAAAPAPTAAPTARQAAQNAAPECLATLAAFGGSAASARGRANTHGLNVTGLSWSKAGQTLAASFGRHDARGLRSQPGALATWNVARAAAGRGDGGGTGSGAAPDRLLDVEAALMCCAFHPGEPALLAGGCISGEVIVWDLSRDDAEAQVSKTDLLSEARHREPVTALSWQYSGHEAARHGGGAGGYRLFSLSADGRLLVWLWPGPRGADGLADPVLGFEVRGAAPGAAPHSCWGCSCLAFCPSASAHEEAGLLLVGTEGGQLLRCQVGDSGEPALRDFAARLSACAAAGASGGAAQLELRGARHGSGYQACVAPVNSLAACPHQRQLALAACGDGTLRLLDVLRAAPLLLLQPCACGLLSAAWSPSRPAVFAVGSGDGRVWVYDLAARQRLLQPAVQLAHAVAGGAAGRGGVHALAFNAAAPGTLAASAGDTVRVWALPPGLAVPRPGEAKLLRRLLDCEDASGLLRVQRIVP